MARKLRAGQLGYAGSGVDLMALESALYEGTVRHTRLRPVHHDFSYRVYYGLFDIDELDALDRRLRWLSVGRFNLFSFHPADHGVADGSPLRPWVESTLAEAGLDLEGGRIMLLAMPRILGYVFNPLSIWYCYGPEGDLRAVIHEVRNTFGDRHSYVVPVEREGLRHRFGKEMHVSPFNAMDQTYSFTVNAPGSRLAVSIGQSDGEGELLRAGMALTRQTLDDRSLIRLFFTHPLVTVKVIAAIHWQAFRLWLKGAVFHHRPEPASHRITVVGARSLTS